MDKHRVRRIEKELAKLQLDDGAEQRNVEQLLRDLNKIYGDGQGSEPMRADEFQRILQDAFTKYEMQEKALSDTTV